ncbi:MAG: tRNA (guanosine(46)-N7)-methyltransferase TrmB, partial [Clostridiales bacterium]
MIYQALLRLEDAAPDNLRFLWAKAEFLGEIFAAQEVNRLYLNFSDPWPKARHHKRRLTYQSFLDIYRYILADDGSLFFKTDNKDFFFWSKEQFLENHWLIAEEDQALPLSKAGFTTEYEDRYRRRGQPIYFLHLQKQEP